MIYIYSKLYYYIRLEEGDAELGEGVLLLVRVVDQQLHEVEEARAPHDVPIIIHIYVYIIVFYYMLYPQRRGACAA